MSTTEYITDGTLVGTMVSLLSTCRTLNTPHHTASIVVVVKIITLVGDRRSTGTEATKDTICEHTLTVFFIHLESLC